MPVLNDMQFTTPQFKRLLPLILITMSLRTLILMGVSSEYAALAIGECRTFFQIRSKNFSVSTMIQKLCLSSFIYVLNEFALAALINSGSRVILLQILV